MKIQDLEKLNIPFSPGLYFFKDDEGKILYIGKATSLRDRVRSYFGPDLIKTRGPHLVDMVFKAVRIEWEVCNNALEALILEANAIKKWKPYYNTKEKDDKSFNCVVITKEIFPQVLLVRQKDIDSKNKLLHLSRLQKSSLHISNYVKLDAIFGPYPQGGAIREGMHILRRIFPYRDKASIQKDKETFYRQLGLTPDIRDSEAKVEYKMTIKNIKLFLSGKFKELHHSLEQQMQLFAKKQEFEKAQEIKKKLFALDHIQDIALLKRNVRTESSYIKKFRIEAYDIAHISGENMVGVMVVIENGVATKGEYRKFKIRTLTGPNDPGALREVLTRRLGHSEWDLPQLIIVDGNEIQKRATETLLQEKGFQIDVIAVVKDARHKPKALIGKASLIEDNKLSILLANQEAHRFAIAFHKNRRRKNFIP